MDRIDAIDVHGLAEPLFRGFARSAFWPFRRRLTSLAVDSDLISFRRAMREACPTKPGCYGMIDGRGELVYVGVSKTLRKRLITYFQGGETVRKERAVAAQAARVVWEVVGHPLVAQLRELDLIRAHRPRLNVQGRRRVRPLGFLYLSADTAPRVRIGRHVPRAARHWWGPLKINWQIREAVEIVNRLFKLCDCPASTPMHFADQRRLFAPELRLECLRGEIGTCLGPCAGRCTRKEYESQIRAARFFLDGGDPTPMASLESQLRQAVETLEFERAARRHESLERLRHLARRLELLREPPLPDQVVYPIEVGRHTVWLLIAAGELKAATRPPLDREGASRCRKLFRDVFDGSDRQLSGQPDRLAAAIVATWFRKHPGELQRLLSPEACL